MFFDYNTIAYLRSDLKSIVVDYDFFIKDNLSNPLRFALAHELGHYFLHKNLYLDLPFKTHEEWINFHINIVTEREYRFFEGQANQFAGRFLVPHDLLRDQVEKSLALIKNRPNIIKVLKENPDIILSGISPPMRRFFGVSEDVIERRVLEEKLWPPKIKSLI